MQIQAGNPGGDIVDNMSIGGGITNAQGRNNYNYSDSFITNASGDISLLLFPGGNYTFTAKPPSGSIYAPFTLQNITVTGNQTEVISLQYVHPPLTINPVGVWIGLKNSDDVGTKFDLKAEVLKGQEVVASGELNSFNGGSSGFNNANLATIPMDIISQQDFPDGSVLSLKLYVRNTCIGPSHNSGVARLWYNDSAANSKFEATIGGTSSSYFLRDGFALTTTPGTGPKKTKDVQAGAKCSPYKDFGTWTITL